MKKKKMKAEPQTRDNNINNLQEKTIEQELTISNLHTQPEPLKNIKKTLIKSDETKENYKTNKRYQ